jgi:hypothetical protein
LIPARSTDAPYFKHADEIVEHDVVTACPGHYPELAARSAMTFHDDLYDALAT